MKHLSGRLLLARYRPETAQGLLQRGPAHCISGPGLLLIPAGYCPCAGCHAPHTPAGMTIRSMEARHWPQVRTIYEAGMATGNATFATQVARGQGWNKAHLPHSRLVALHPSGGVLGWAALASVAGQSDPPGVAEIQVYVAPGAQGQGVGHALLAALVKSSEAHGIWTLHAVVFPENQVIQRLCEGAGFRVAARYTRIGQLHGIWRDTLVLERRSALVGTFDSSLLPVSRPLSAAPSHSVRNTMGSVTLTHTG